MTTLTARPVLTDMFWTTEGSQIWLKRLILLVAGVVGLAIAAKIKIPMWPVPITMGTFAILTIGAALGAPAVAFIVVAGWVLFSLLVHWVRFAQAAAARGRGAPVASFLKG